jgi:aspartyl-tRNA(Asn)/glutamyl-tRNA(Gln) amidotransferase subunit C
MFDRKDFEYLRKLCRLQCSDEEEAELISSLQKIFDFIEQLKEIDTEGVLSCNYVLRSMLKDQMREDEIKDLLPRDQFLAGAPDQIGGMVRVPPVMKGEP